jgi:WD40 repeat protein
LSASCYLDKNPIILWDFRKGRKVRSYENLDSRRNFISFLPDGKHFVVADRHNDATLLDTNSGEIIRSWKSGEEHYFLSECGALSPDGKKLLLGSCWCDEYAIWDIESGREKWIKTPGGILSLALSPDGRTTACGRENGIDFYRFDTGEKIKSFSLPLTRVTALAFSPDGKQIAVGSDNNASAYYSVHFKILDFETGASRFSLFTPSDCSSFAVCNPDGKHIYTHASHNIMKIWDTATGREVSRITGDWRDIRYAGISPDGKYLAGALEDSDIIKIWDAVTGSELHSISTGFSDEIESLHFRCGGNKIIAFASDYGPHVFDVQTGRYIMSLPGKNLRGQPNFSSSDDRYFAVISDSDDPETKSYERGKIVTVFDTETASPVFSSLLPIDYGDAVALYYAPGITLAAFYKWDYKQPEDKQHTITIYNAVSGEILYSKIVSYINEEAITFNPSGETFTLSYGMDLQIIPVNPRKNGEILHIQVNHKGSITHVTYLPDVLLSSSRDTIDISDSKTGKLLQTIEEGTDLLLLPTSGDGRFLATASNSLVKTWDIEKKALETALPVCHYPESAACIPGGKELFFADNDSRVPAIYRYDTTTGKLTYAFQISDKLTSVKEFCFRPGADEMIIQDWNDRAVVVHNFKTGKELLTIRRKGNIICAYNHNGNFLVCCGGHHYIPLPKFTRKIHILNAGTGDEIKKFPRSLDVTCVAAFSHDDKYLVTGSIHHKIVLWDLETAAAIRTYTGHKDEINMVAFTHDGKRIVSSSDDAIMRIWDRESAVCLAVFPGISKVITESVSNPAWRFIVALTVHWTVKLFSKDTLEEAMHLVDFKDGRWSFA